MMGKWGSDQHDEREVMSLALPRRQPCATITLSITD